MPDPATQAIPVVPSALQGPVVTEAAARQVVCPECGTQGRVTLNRRASEDFCVQCDYPLFWTPSAVLLDHRGSADSLRRLPGAAGRQTVGSTPCPHCSEVNLMTAVTCVRCGGQMQAPAAPVLAPPPPPPPPAPAPEPAPTGAWVWVVLGVTVALLIAMIVYLLVR